MQYFLGKMVVVANKHSDRNGQRAQVVSERASVGEWRPDLVSQYNNGTLTLRFSDGTHQEMCPAGVSMSADQTTPVWPPPVEQDANPA